MRHRDASWSLFTFFDHHRKTTEVIIQEKRPHFLLSYYVRRKRRQQKDHVLKYDFTVRLHYPATLLTMYVGAFEMNQTLLHRKLIDTFLERQRELGIMTRLGHYSSDTTFTEG